MLKPTTLLLAILLIGNAQLQAQADDRVAYVPSKAPSRTVDDLSITFLEPVVPGELEVALPAGTFRVDLLNAHGNIKQVRSIEQADKINIRKLRRGTWTLRAHTPSGMVVRRFFVMGRGTVLTELPRSRRRH
ncbi:MAG: hypothetical protein M3R08_11875 [Bacteroidota bacterium]|nr:hypothetical protein [Bacteroidota bacterium]